MMFVRATGPMDRLNEFNLKTLSVNYYHPENAAEYMSGADGWHAVTENCPFDIPIKHIEDIAEQTDFDLTHGVSNIFGTDKPLTSAYLKKLTKYVSENDFDSSDINLFLSGLKPAVDSYSKKHFELQNREKELTQKIDKLSHFQSLDVDINEMTGTEYIDVHFGSLPKDSMIKLYMYNHDNKFIFNTYSSDDKYFWGVYCVSRQHSQEAAKIMSALYFDELKFDTNEGSVQDIIEKCKKELDEVKIQQNEINEFWERNKQELVTDYSILLDLQKLWQFRKNAVIKGETFCCIGWIPKKQQNQARQLFASVNEVEFTIKAPETSVTAAGLSSSSPFERPIRDIEHLSHHVSYDLTQDRLKCCIGTHRPLSDEYIKKCTRYLGGADINSDDNGFYGLNGEIHSLAQHRKELKAREKFLKKKINRLNHFISLDIDISELHGISYSVVRFGRLPTEYMEKVSEYAQQKGFVFNVCSYDDKNCWCIYCVPKKYAEETDKLFDEMYFKLYKITETSGTVSDIIKGYKSELDIIATEKQHITDFWNKHKAEIIDCYSILQDLQHLWSIKKNITQKNGKYIYTGSENASTKKKILTLYTAIGGFSSENENVQEEAIKRTPLTPPTKLRNLKIFKPYEYYVKMYGMPSYGSIDITSFVAITYTILFGIMFGDLGQGFILAVGGFLAWKLKKIELGKIIIPCGISSMFFGLIFGSLFGFEEALDPLYHAVGLSGKPLSVMDSINTVLLVAIGIGIALVATSICINIYANIKAKKYGVALFDNNGLAGLVLYLCGVSLVIDFMGNIQIIPTTVLLICMPVCAVILFIKEILIGIVDKHENWKPESISDFIMQNVFEMLEYVLSYFSNTVSFLRVGAFVLVHAGMMMVVFSLAGENENIFVIILGNILVICLEGLLTGIQALRLEFYEMFSRCFAGDGKAFISAKSILADMNTNK